MINQSNYSATLSQRSQNGGRQEMLRIAEDEDGIGTWTGPLEGGPPSSPVFAGGVNIPLTHVAKGPAMKEPPAVAPTLSQIIMGVEPSGKNVVFKHCFDLTVFCPKIR